jgi:hypothetical protein
MATAKKSAKKSTGSGPACWPGFKRVPGTKAGAKGSCEPKAHQTSGEKKADSKAAAARKREKTATTKHQHEWVPRVRILGPGFISTTNLSSRPEQDGFIVVRSGETRNSTR